MPETSQGQTALNDPADVRFGKILNEFLDRRARGEQVSEGALYDRHPEFADELRDSLELARELNPASSTLGDLVARGVLRRSADSHYAAQLGPHKIISLIGQGGMGIVLRAYEESLNRTVALKLLRPELVCEPGVLGRFRQEAKAAAALRHPNIVTVHAVGESRGIHYITMEYVEGPTLAALIRENGGLPAESIRSLFCQVLTGLYAAHQAGMVHRDIKSSNVLLDAPGQQAKIADFGLALISSGASRMTLPDSVLGTPEYMSPEQARGDRNVDHRSDLYSAGVVLYEMLTGRTPFKAATPSGVVYCILHEEPADPTRLNSEADPQLASLALRLMAKRSEDRLGSAAEVLHALDSGDRVRSMAWRRRLRRRLATVIFVLGCIVAAAWLSVSLPASPHVEHVWSTPQDDDEHLRTIIWANYSDGRTKARFHDFGKRIKAITACGRVDSDGDGTRDLVAAGVGQIAGKHSLFAFDYRRRERWRLDLSPKITVAWPDLNDPPAYWTCRALEIADVDGVPGDELIATAREHSSYPSSLTVVDTRRGTTGSTFYHTGELSGLFVVPDYFGPDHPAVVAWGGNNKLDGYDHSFEGCPSPMTAFDIVQVVMILDPMHMDGLGPPHPVHPELTPLGVAVPWAYAFVNLPSSSREERTGVRHDPARTATIRSVERWPSDRSTIAVGPFLEIKLGASMGGPGRVSLRVDRDLSFRSASIRPQEQHRIDQASWEEVWRPIIQQGRYVSK